jgi:hypothetical protein
VALFRGLVGKYRLSAPKPAILAESTAYYYRVSNDQLLLPSPCLLVYQRIGSTSATHSTNALLMGRSSLLSNSTASDHLWEGLPYAFWAIGDPYTDPLGARNSPGDEQLLKSQHDWKGVLTKQFVTKPHLWACFQPLFWLVNGAVK